METRIRGIIEKHIDRHTQPENLEIYIKSFRRFPIKSMEDCLFGYIVGCVITEVAYLTATMKGRVTTLDELKELWGIIDERAMEIRGRIKLALGK